MKNVAFIFVLVIILILSSSSAFAYDTSEYLEEFSNEGEVCQAIDIFEYHQLDPQWWNNNYISQTIPVFYQCCKDDSCTTIIVDFKEKGLMRDKSYKELIDLNYIK
jgi:hypothetical protein